MQKHDKKIYDQHILSVDFNTFVDSISLSTFLISSLRKLSNQQSPANKSESTFCIAAMIYLH